METLSTESTPRERLARLLSLLGRVRMYWRSTLAIAVVGVAVSLAIALVTKRVWRSESTILYREVLQTGQSYGTGERAARLGPKLKDMLYARPKLSSVIEEFGLYPEKTSRSMVEAVAEMQTNIGFRSRDSDTYVISFSHHDPVVAQRVTARMADLIIEEYQRENLTSATMTRDFLRRELEDASTKVEEASRALATFLARNPQFQWGMGDSPYAPTPGQGMPGAMPAPHVAKPLAPRRPLDPELASLERRLAQVDAQLSPGMPAPAPGAPAAAPQNVVDAEKARETAAASLAAAEAALADKLRTVTALHPDAVGAQARVDQARRELAAAESALRMVRSGVKAPAATDGPAPDLDPAKKAELEKERASLFRQIAARRQQLAQGAPAGAAPAPAADPKKAAPADPVDAVVELETEWHRLRLELDRARDYLKTVQSNERAANMLAEAAEKKSDTEMAILDPAYLPARPDRGRGRVFFVGAALAFMFAFGLAGARVLLNDTLYDEADVGALGGPPVLAAMPEIPVPEAAARAMVPLTDSPDSPGRPMPASSEVEQVIEPEVVEPAGQRLHAVTLRWGSAMPPVALPARPSATALARVEPAPLAQVRASMSGRRLQDDVEVIGLDPDFDEDGAFALLRSAPQQVLASLRVLRHRLEQRRADGRMIVSVVSPGAGEGKTTLAARLAMTLAEADRARVVLVEGNLMRPRLAAALGVKLPEHAGLSQQVHERMQGRKRPLGVVQVGSSLWALAEPVIGAAYPDVLHSPHFEQALQTLKRSFDYVVVDGPAVLGSGEANVLEDVSDGVVLVARASMTRGANVTRAVAQLGDRRILGVVLNDVSERPVAKKRMPVAAEEHATV